MSLKERIYEDVTRLYMNHTHFAEWHTWNGRRFQCVVDEDTALKRKNNNVVDVSWDNNSVETLIYTPVKEMPGRAMPNEQVNYDGKFMKILQVQEDMGMYTILLASNLPKAVAE